MNKDDKIKYLANIYYLLQSDGGVERVEEDLFEGVSREIHAGYFEKKEAKKLAQGGSFRIQMVERWSDRIRNLEDVLFAAFCDGTVDPSEKQMIQAFANKIGINQKQFDVVKDETRRRYAEFKENPIR